MNTPRPPSSEQELARRATEIAGLTVAELAARVGQPLPRDRRRAKGFVGQLLEIALGASAASRPEPDFQLIGVELKTVPVDERGRPMESTYVCTLPLEQGPKLSGWASSNVRRKLNRVMWVPVQASAGLSLATRRVGSAILWSPSPEEEAKLRADWEELTEMVATGRVAAITAHQGTCLQVRPKAADSHARRWGVDEAGHRVRTLPRGFYLRTSFTAAILAARYAGLSH